MVGRGRSVSVGSVGGYVCGTKTVEDLVLSLSIVVLSVHGTNLVDEYVSGWKRVVVGGTYLVVVGGTYLVVVGGTYLVVVGGTYLVVVGGTYLVVVGGTYLVVSLVGFT